ncbi:FAD-dependent oxidoreductase [Devosia sp. 1566]|uniref:FAD-dependent oxidoreductase n=1 Tax=Devosia sp. 1566 TaxID=2499144 RepID=UPI000FDC49F2|nr:FAD-dependent oxidoreductase [Devosia sp. 1566]
MSQQPNRLDPAGGHGFAGTQIDRSRPLQFQLNGYEVEGFEGDTVLSAALASGIEAIGRLGGRPLGLGPRFAPAVSVISSTGSRGPAVPMQQAPAVNGAEMVTDPAGPSGTSPLGRVRRLLGPSRSLDLQLDRLDALPEAWRNQGPTPAAPSDLIVVGGGVAGMTAALTGLVLGLGVTLVESSPCLGGSARLFGTQEGEETPDESISRLVAAIQQTGKIRIVTRAQAFAAAPGLVRAHVVEEDGGSWTSQVLDFAAPHIVLATGTIERLPIFSGNRLPGVMTTLDAFELAHRYGVWPGQSALVATVSNAAYRLAMLASDAGITVRRTLDARPQPQSRFIEFCKAYGITMAPGTLLGSIEPGERERGLRAVPQLALGDLGRQEAPFAVERVLVCGGFQPDLGLWHMAGGASSWDGTTARLVPKGTLPGIALAGAAGGYLSRQACMMSGADAVYALTGQQRPKVEERLIDPLYETPDAPTPISLQAAALPDKAFLSESGLHVVAPAADSATGILRGWFLHRPRSEGSLADAQSLGVAEVAAAVQLGTIPAESAGHVAQERAAVIPLGDATPAAPPGRQSQAGLVPPFLAGRFGNDPKLWLVAPGEARALDRGALIHLASDRSDPRNAIGVVVAALDGGAIALIGKPGAQVGEWASLRDHGGAIPIRLVAPYRDDMDLAAALGRGTGAA